MKIINEQYEYELLQLESKTINRSTACNILEKAVIQQFMSLNLGLLSDKLLCEDISNNELQTMRNILIELYPDDIEAICQDTLTYIANGIYAGKWTVISVSELDLVEIRIFGGNVKLWDVFEINEQLSVLLSDIRVYFAGSMNLLNIHMKKQFGKDIQSNSVDARFIVGTVSPVTISYAGRVFDFIEERVCSPFFNSNVPGFSIEDSAIIRRKVILDICPDTSEAEQRILHVYLHEAIHTLSYTAKDNFPYSSSNWEIILRRDICRYLKHEHTIEDLERAFELIIHNPFISILEESRFTQFTSFKNIFESLPESVKLVF